jgi:hypothetical protein
VAGNDVAPTFAPAWQRAALTASTDLADCEASQFRDFESVERARLARKLGCGRLS